jgi:hypothetical protein
LFRVEANKIMRELEHEGWMVAASDYRGSVRSLPYDITANLVFQVGIVGVEHRSE